MAEPGLCAKWCASPVALVFLQRLARMPQRMLHITDIHFWEVVRNPLKLVNKRMLGNANVLLRRRRHFLQQHAEAHLAAALATGAQTVLLGGDFTSTATENEFRRAAAWTRALAGQVEEVALLPGNHDVYTFESVRRRRFEHHFREFLPQEGYPATIPLKNGVTLVMAPTVCADVLSSRGRISKDAVQHTARLVREASQDAPLIVMAHYPCLHRTHAYASGWARQLGNADALRHALGVCNRPLLFLAGHVHRFSFVRDPDYPQLSHLCSPAFFYHRPGSDVDGAFCEIHAHSEDNFEVFLHEHRAEWRSEARPLLRIDGAPL